MSNDAMRDAIAVGLAALAREIAASEAPFGYGVDLICVTDLDPNLREEDPNSPLGIARAAVRRLIADRGSLIDDPDYGFGLISLLNRGLTQADLQSMPERMALELDKDDRIADTEIEVTLAVTTLRVKLVITPVDPSVTEIDLTFAVTDGAAVIEAFSVAA